MSRYTIGIVGHDDPVRPASHCFKDFAKALADALRALGHEVIPPHFPSPGRLIMFGANNIVDQYGTMPADAICYNAEQVSAIVAPTSFISSREFSNRVVWDYAQSNVDVLRAKGFKRAVLCPYGYIPSMTTIVPSPEREDIDVLFYGSLNEHRRKILHELERSGLNVVRLFHTYDEERDAVIARAKIILNVHYYERGVHEIFRTGHAMANRKCVVSEAGGRDPALEDFASRATRYVPYDQIVGACRELVADRDARREQAQRGFEAFSKLDFVAGVRRALEESAP